MYRHVAKPRVVFPRQVHRQSTRRGCNDELHLLGDRDLLRRERLGIDKDLELVLEALQFCTSQSTVEWNLLEQDLAPLDRERGGYRVEPLERSS
jgi:hypothetical protein